MLSVANQQFIVEIVLSAANQCSLPKLYGQQQTTVHCRNCVVCSVRYWNCFICSESAIHHWNCVLSSESVFAAEIVICSESTICYQIVWSIANECSLLKLYGLQRISVLCWNYVSAANRRSLLKLCCLKLCDMQWISNLLPNCVVCSKWVFSAETVWSAMNQHSLPKLCVYSESMFIAEIVLPASNQFSLLECVPCSEAVLAARLYCLQRGSSRCRIVLPAARQFSLSDCVASSEAVLAAEF
jgi:hypothetical protein